MIKSMTGFGRGENSFEGRKFTVEIKTVNHRFTDIFVKYPRSIAFVEDKVREVLSKTLSRGKVDVFITYEDNSETTNSVTVNEVLAESYVNAFLQLKKKFELKDDVTMSLITRMPEVIKVEFKEDDQEFLWGILKPAVDEAVNKLIKMREVEGETLRLNLNERADYIFGLLSGIEDRAPNVASDYKVKLENRLSELLDGAEADPQRVAMEVAIIADKCSIDEELIRFKSHISQFKETLNENIPVGRKLDFVIQEMNREINTIGSKANDVEITKTVIEVKSEIEKLREQIQNIE